MKDENTKITPELVPAEPNTTLNENNTVYDLLPTIVNKPPVVVQSIAEASVPQIKASSAAISSNEDYMYKFPDGNTKVHTNTNITLKVVAEQPDVYNVENGELVLKQAQEDLVYAWTLNGQRIVADDEEPSLRSSRRLNGNTITITNMIPKYAGVYNCTISNDIGSTDGGTVSLEVFNSDVDDSFYTNLVQNPNGTAEDGSLTTEGWISAVGNLQSKQLSPTTEPTKHKKIIVDPFNPEFEWTSEMLYPKTYQVDGGSLRNNALENLNSYFTRTDYNYIRKDGESLFSAYQDIDLTNLQPHIQGSIYGINGVRVVLSFYLGMAIYNYIPASPYINPETRTNLSTYYLGAPRLSFENFIKAGPGFVKELAYVELIEYDKEERLQSRLLNQPPSSKPIKVTDPWNKRLPQYNNRVYYEGGRFKASPDQPSKGDSRDRHLFVADELVPNPDDRFTYGQYAELNKIVLDRLNPRTNKLRIAISIEPRGMLEYTLREGNKQLINGVSSGIFEAVSWEKAYKSLSVEPNNSNEREMELIGNILDNFRKSEPLDLRIPKASNSKAFMSGFNLSLIPLEKGKDAEIQREVDLLISKNTRVPGALSTTTLKNLSPFDARDKGNRNLDISFEMAPQGTLNVSLVSSNPDIPDQADRVLSYSAGLFPFTSIGEQVLVLNEGDTNQPSTYSPTYRKGDLGSLIYTDTYDISAYTKNNNDDRVGVTYIKGGSTFVGETDEPLYLAPEETNGEVYAATQLTQNSIYETPTEFDNGVKSTWSYPELWYSIDDDDKLAIYNQEELSQDYTKWSTPQNPISLNGWRDDWSSILDTAAFKDTTATWNRASRFIVTIGVHNTNLESNNKQSIHSTETYYLDFVQNNAVLHKTPNIGDMEFLPGFSTEEQYTNDPYTFLNLRTNTYESYVSEDWKTFTTKFLEQQQMDPVVIPITVPGDSINNTVTLDIPQSVLTGSRLSGGLNIPTITTTTDGNSVNVIADPSYEVVLYGIRPITSGKFLGTDGTPDAGALVGTPLKGSDSLGNTYSVRNISVANKQQ